MLLAEIQEWRERNKVVFARCEDESTWQLDESSPLAAGVAGLLGNLPRTMSEILDSLSAGRLLATEQAALLLAEGALIPAEPELDDSSIADLSVDEESLSLAEPDDSLDISFDGGEIDVGLFSGSSEMDVPDADGLSEIDYEKAAQGGFIKSYDVLDKVDLSGVAVLGTGQNLTDTRPDASAVPLHSLGEIEAIGDDDLEDETALPDLEISRGPADESDGPRLTSFETGDFDSAFDQGSVDGDDPDVGGNAGLGLASVSGEADGEDPLLASVDTNARERFDVDELRGFADRITIFSSIFRIIFATFAEHIGAPKARQRFNALLGSSQRQYPELFRRLEVEQDGAIQPSTLINNLAACPPGDYGSLLHQGLYELIFSHLYDAKDLLPGDAETNMMEQIVVFERLLHEA